MGNEVSHTSANGLARKAGCSVTSVISAIARGELAAEKLGTKTGAYLIQTDEAERWAAARRARSPASSPPTPAPVPT